MVSEDHKLHYYSCRCQTKFFIFSSVPILSVLFLGVVKGAGFVYLRKSRILIIKMMTIDQTLFSHLNFFVIRKQFECFVDIEDEVKTHAVRLAHMWQNTSGFDSVLSQQAEPLMHGLSIQVGWE